LAQYWFTMKLVTYRYAGRDRVGFRTDDGVVPLDAPDLLSLIDRDELPSSSERALPLAELSLLAPIPRPRRNIFCIGKNYAEHAAEFHRSGYDASGKEAQPDAPVFFTKPPSTVIGHGASIDPHLGVTSELDYEAELGVVIRRGGRGIKRENALEHVFGYVIINDVTARDLQKRHKQWFLGKGLDTFCPMGPWLVTADEVGREPLELVCRVNGEQRQRASTADLIFDVPAIIEALSAGITLEPGDIIATGTPKGVGIGFDPPRFLKPGDTVSISISKLGTLENTVKPQ
jgi:2-keto-4-pentenoate hydratase/2-oxohepta-3-ene-1,7-dioic acid hydratase in catechol pathway